jgi:DNA-binding HxlR family transcriptional regulator
MLFDMARERSYLDGCASAHALDLVGERWALLVVRELLLGPKRFTDLRAGIPDVSPDVLGRRLRELEHAGILVRRKLAPPAGSHVYELTDWGYELEPIVVGLGRWGSRSPAHPRDGALGEDSIVLALKAEFDPDAAKRLSASYELRLGENHFRVEVADGRIEVGRGIAAKPDAIITTDPGTLASLLWNGRQLADALRSGDIRIAGSQTMVTRFLGLFPLPEPATRPAQE